MKQIAILGAECTGKSELAKALTQRLSEEKFTARWIPEVLRDWCDREGRTPLAHEQAAIASTQVRLAKTALPCDFLLVDSPALMTAIYSDLYFSDQTLYPFTLDHLCRHYQLTLVMGTDLKWVPDGIQRDGPLMRQQVDQRLRQVLADASLPYTVIYGTGSTRIDNAMRAIQALANATCLKPTIVNSGWVWHCENCSDSQCESRLFTERLQINPTSCGASDR